MAARDRDGVDHLAAQLVRDLPEVRYRQRAQVGRHTDAVGKRGFGSVAHISSRSAFIPGTVLTRHYRAGFARRKAKPRPDQPIVLTWFPGVAAGPHLARQTWQASPGS